MHYFIARPEFGPMAHRATRHHPRCRVRCQISPAALLDTIEEGRAIGADAFEHLLADSVGKSQATTVSSWAGFGFTTAYAAASAAFFAALRASSVTCASASRLASSAVLASTARRGLLGGLYFCDPAGLLSSPCFYRAARLAGSGAMGYNLRLWRHSRARLSRDYFIIRRNCGVRQATEPSSPALADRHACIFGSFLRLAGAPSQGSLQDAFALVRSEGNAPTAVGKY